MTTYTLDILRAFQEEMECDDDTLISLLAVFVDKAGMAEKFKAYLAVVAVEWRDADEVQS